MDIINVIFVKVNDRKKKGKEMIKLCDVVDMLYLFEWRRLN